jgi:hypothetical protein
MYLRTVERESRLKRKYAGQLSAFKTEAQTFSQNPIAPYPGEKQKKQQEEIVKH